MLVGAPHVEAEQNSSIRIEDLPKVIMGRNGSRLTEQRLVPFQAARHVAYPYDRPRALHRVPFCGLIFVYIDLQRPVRIEFDAIPRLVDDEFHALVYARGTAANLRAPSRA